MESFKNTRETVSLCTLAEILKNINNVDNHPWVCFVIFLSFPTDINSIHWQYKVYSSQAPVFHLVLPMDSVKSFCREWEKDDEAEITTWGIYLFSIMNSLHSYCIFKAMSSRIKSSAKCILKAKDFKCIFVENYQ